MGLATYGITHQRETAVARLLRHVWLRLRVQTPTLRLRYTVGGLVCDGNGAVSRDRLNAALNDPAVTQRGLALLAVVRYKNDDGGEWVITG
ncbi:MAG TPA: hypothetical protein VGH76_25180 [Actinomycetospora sp.]|uniref:hypothetical protein n=1 Tax=Actinomycetospora sp. TaxID=1872135 RepID=UPI002F42BFC3